MTDRKGAAVVARIPTALDVLPTLMFGRPYRPCSWRQVVPCARRRVLPSKS